MHACVPRACTRRSDHRLRGRARADAVEKPPEAPGQHFDPAVVAARLDTLLRELPRPATGLCVAYSGGLDSTVLLHALACRPDRASRPRLAAVHVDHGLQAQSPLWSRRCAEVAAALNVPCRVLCVDARPPRGASPEAWARRQRRAAISDVLAIDEVLLTAHHADDQLETVLLQLLRGGGPAGIAGMPWLAPFGRGWQARPLLGVSRSALRTWAETVGIDWSEDPTNLDLRFDRNYLRHALLPAVRSRWPNAAMTVGRGAALTAEVCELAALVAEADLAVVREGRTLPIALLDQLSEPRQRAVLRAWITGLGLHRAVRTHPGRLAAGPPPCRRRPDSLRTVAGRTRLSLSGTAVRGAVAAAPREREAILGHGAGYCLRGRGPARARERGREGLEPGTAAGVSRVAAASRR